MRRRYCTLTDGSFFFFFGNSLMPLLFAFDLTSFQQQCVLKETDGRSRRFKCWRFFNEQEGKQGQSLHVSANAKSSTKNRSRRTSIKGDAVVEPLSYSSNGRWFSLLFPRQLDRNFKLLWFCRLKVLGTSSNVLVRIYLSCALRGLKYKSYT